MKCQSNNENGRPCGAKSVKGRQFCYFHSQDHDIRELRHEAQTRGGKQRKTKATLPSLNFDFTDVHEIPALLSRLAEQVYTGALDRARAATISHLADGALRALDVGTFADERAQLKQLFEGEKALPPDLVDAIEQTKQADQDRSFREHIVELSRAILLQNVDPAKGMSPEGDKNRGLAELARAVLAQDLKSAETATSAERDQNDGWEK